MKLLATHGDVRNKIKKWGLSISGRETLIKYASCIFNSISDWVNFARGEAIGYTWRCMKYDKKKWGLSISR